MSARRRDRGRRVPAEDGHEMLLDLATDAFEAARLDDLGA